MANISRIKLDETTYEIKDAQAARASDLALKQDALTAGNGIAIDSSDIIRTTGIPFGTCDSTSTSKVFTATVPGIYKLEDGVCCIIKNGVVTSESGFTLNVNGLGAKPSYSNMATGNDVTPTDPTRDTTIFNINYAMLFVYSSTIVDGGGWICYRGYDANTNTIGYQVRSNSQSLPASQKFYRYRLLFTSADGTHYVPANTSSSTNATSSRTVNQTPIDPFGPITYYGTTAAVEANARPAASSLWIIYTLNLGYSFNRTGAALTLSSWAPVYVKCAPQSNGSAIIDADNPYVQALPTTNDGKIYIFLGIAYSATNIELLNNHPVYYHDDTGIKLWIGEAIPSQSDIDAAKPFIITITPTYGEPTTYSADKTFAEITSAYDDGRDLLVNCENYYYNLKHVSDNKTLFDFELIDSENRVGQVFTITTQSITYEEYYYQSPLTFDNLPTANSNNPVKSGGVYTALANKADKTLFGVLTASYDNEGRVIGYTCDKTYSELYNAITNGTQVLLYEVDEWSCYLYPTDVSDGLSFKSFFEGDFRFYVNIDDQNVITWGSREYQRRLTFDNIPTQNSNNPVKSGGVYSALQGKEDKCLIVTFTKNNDVYSADKTFTQIATASSNGIKVFGVLEYELYNLVYCEDEAIFQSNFENSFSTLVVGGNYVEYHQGEFVKYKQYSNVTDLNSDDPDTGTIGWIPSTGVFYIYEGGSQRWKKLIVDSDLSSYVPTSRTINGKALTTNITLNASDVGAVPTAISTTYSSLVTKRNNSQLIPGAWYRITDYNCTTTQMDTQSAGHQFDILVQATSPNTLSEEAKAIHHEGDTYFANANLEDWKIWYCLDNDTTRFAWADTTNGKGVIYRMIDEWDNDCPYDFKNILFKRYKITSCPKSPSLVGGYSLNGIVGITVNISTPFNVYTFCMLNGSTPNDVSVKQEEYLSDEGCYYHTHNNCVKELYDAIELENSDQTRQVMMLPNNVFVTDTDLAYIEDNYGEFYAFNSNTFGNNCSGNTFGNDFSYNTFGNTCYANTFGGFCRHNIFKNRCSGNTFGNEFCYNTFGNNCSYNIFKYNCYYNTFGNLCQQNTFGDACESNTFGSTCYSNTFGDTCNCNTFKNNCNSNTLGNNCYSNIFGNGCISNTFSKPYTQHVIVENGNMKITLTSTLTPTGTNPLRNITIAQGVNNTNTTKTVSHNTLNDTFRTTYTVDDNGDIYAITPTKYDEWDSKQPALVSGTNIKTINNQSLLGSGNLTPSDIGAGIFLVTITSTGSGSNITYSANKTFSQIADAITSGRNVIAQFGEDLHVLMYYEPGASIYFTQFYSTEIRTYTATINISSSNSIHVYQFTPVNNLTTNSPGSFLDAYQGKVLKDLVDTKQSKFVVEFTLSGTTISNPTKTFTEIQTAYGAGNIVLARDDANSLYYLLYCMATGCGFFCCDSGTLYTIDVNSSDTWTYQETNISQLELDLSDKSLIIYMQKVNNVWKKLSYNSSTGAWLVDNTTLTTGNTKNIYLDKDNSDLYYWNGSAFTLLSGDKILPDWDQDDNTQVDYIKNKPNIPVKISDLSDDKGILTEEDVSVLTLGNGTLDINVGSNVYTVDLSHSHPQYLTTHQSLSGYAKYVLCADETEYNDILNKDSSTLYLIPESNV